MNVEHEDRKAAVSAVTDASLLRVEALQVWFPLRRRLGLRGRGPALHVKAVDGVSLSAPAGAVIGVVGESGCGKSTLARAVVRLEQPTAGRVWLAGHDIAALSAGALRRLRPMAQMIFQDPYASLNPRMTVFDAVAEPLRVHGHHRGMALAREVQRLMDQVGLARRYVRKYPHEFSGGQRQRIAIARALALRPKLLLADEPVSALDVSVQAQIINLLSELQRETGMTMVFISHDLGVVRHIAGYTHVMYLGRIVESAPTDALFAAPAHPYTRTLLAAVPIPDPERERARERPLPKGEPPSPIHPPTGCPFHPRCPIATPACAEHRPELTPYGTDRHVACSEIGPVHGRQSKAKKISNICRKA